MKTEIGTDVLYAAALLRRGELVGMPTETVYGLAGNALNSDTVLKIYTTKGRPHFNPLIVHLKDASEMSVYGDVPVAARALAERFWPGPLTIVLPKKKNIPDIVTGGGDTVALRVPAHAMARELLSLVNFPLAAPSANPAGYISPVTAEHVHDQLGGKIAYILDGGACSVGIESTVVAFVQNELIVLRAGGVTLEELKRAGASAKLQTHATGQLASPGLLKSHYAPQTKLILGDLENLIEEHRERKLAVLALSHLPRHAAIVAGEVLSPPGDLTQAARNLFAAMRRLDAAGAELLLAERMPERGFGIAINDRLERAAAF